VTPAEKLIAQNEVLIKQNKMIISLLTDQKKPELKKKPVVSVERQDELLQKAFKNKKHKQG
jgi:hypothetical protein